MCEYFDGERESINFTDKISSFKWATDSAGKYTFV